MKGRYYYRRGSTRYYRYRNGRYYGRRRYVSSLFRARGNMRAAKQQPDQATFTINVPTQISTFCFEDNVAGVQAVYIIVLLKNSTLIVQVPTPPQPTLELLTNKQLDNNQTYIVSNLMQDSSYNVGIYIKIVV